MENLFLFLKGLFIGIGKIIPGVSGSLIAVMLGVYERAIFSINHLKEDWKRSFSYLFPLGVGIIISIVLFSYVIAYFLNHYYVFTMFFFLGLLFGTIPAFQGKVKFHQVWDIFFFLIPFFLPFFLSRFSFSISSSLFWYFVLGMIDAASMIIPGISGTAIYLMLGCYHDILLLFQNPLANLLVTGLFSAGLILGVFLVSLLVEYLFQHARVYMYQMIDGFLWSSIVSLFFGLLGSFTLTSVPILCVLFFLGFFLTKHFS